ncbi:baseplate wedge subunit [uncultured Caudovirales phage]|uniref:Baseplate wedge subunit n=1 Tax=uncultured Caudovirales phage TaxID=2100421 RepID=A0A6J5NVH8_9CAUD|nr:baseplate wedge subunit [uncultured Caudovirales phage]
MANSSLQLSSIDFDTLKQNFKTYLSSQSTFKDYDFEGSNINVLLDVMSYNSFLNSFYLNMVASEMFLDSAQKYDSIVSHAKELNYTPRSAKSSVANISFTVSTVGITSPLNIPKGARFSGDNANGNFVFITKENNIYSSANTTYTVNNLQVYEGIYSKDSFIVDYNIENQIFILSNKNIDTDSLSVIVSENNGANVGTYSRVETLFGLSSTSNVYFLQASQNNQYEIVFGDGFFGKKPQNGAVITAEYRVCNGTDAGGITDFICIDDLGDVNGGSASVLTINTISVSSSGANQESIESVKFAAPRYFATQQRAIASDDYSALILNNFGGEISDVAVYGGETIEPKQYGRVIVSVKPIGGTITPDYLKSQITKFLTDYIAIPNRVIFADPDYFYCVLDTTVQYNKNVTTKSTSEIQSTVSESILTFGKDHIETFGSDLRYSKIVAHIDDSDTSITSNDTEIYMAKRISPKLGYSTTYTINFNNKTQSIYPVITSSAFTYIDSNGTSYESVRIEDDANGNIIAYNYINGIKTILNSSLGSIDYETGRLILNDLLTTSYGNYISIYLKPLNKDIIASKNMILLIESSDVTINIIETLK